MRGYTCCICCALVLFADDAGRLGHSIISWLPSPPSYVLMPLIAPSATTPAKDVSDADIRGMEPSTIVVEIERLENSIAKLRESNAALTDFATGNGGGQAAPEDSDRKMYADVVQENDEVM